MQEHVHWGLPTLVVNALATIIIMFLLRVIAARMVDDSRLETIGKAIGGILGTTPAIQTT